MDWKNVPKTELHLHLEGAAPTAFVLEKARHKGLDLGPYVEGDHYKWTDFNGFLACYEAYMRVLSTPSDFADLTRAVLETLADHHVVYTELTLGVILMCQNDPVLWDETLAAMEEVCRTSPVEVRYIPVIVRHFGAEAAIESAKLVTKHGHKRCTGFGMAGAEDYGQPQDYRKAFLLAGEAGLGLTVHSGEWGDPASIAATLDALPVTRLGHGIRAAEDLSLMARIKDADIHLEVCPGSNVALGAATSWAAHPIHKFRKEEISFSISTDDPPHFRTNMTREYTELARLGWQEADFNRANREALRHAFVDEATRTALLGHFGA